MVLNRTYKKWGFHIFVKTDEIWRLFYLDRLMIKGVLRVKNEDAAGPSDRLNPPRSLTE